MSKRTCHCVATRQARLLIRHNSGTRCNFFFPAYLIFIWNHSSCLWGGLVQVGWTYNFLDDCQDLRARFSAAVTATPVVPNFEIVSRHSYREPHSSYRLTRSWRRINLLFFFILFFVGRGFIWAGHECRGLSGSCRNSTIRSRLLWYYCTVVQPNKIISAIRIFRSRSVVVGCYDYFRPTRK